MNHSTIEALFLDDVEVRKKLISAYLKSDAPYEDRLYVWENTPEHLRTKNSWIMHATINGVEVSWYDDFYRERYSDVWVCELRDCDQSLLDSDDVYKDFAEQFMKQGVHGFNLDW